MERIFDAGRLNEKADLKCLVTRVDMTVPPIEINGDPAKGETLKVKWSKFWDEGALLHLNFNRCYVDGVEVAFTEKTKLKAVVLLDGDRALSRHEAETGKLISEKRVYLRADRIAENLTLFFDTWFSGIEIEEVSLWGALADSPIFPVPDSCREGEGRFLFERMKPDALCENAAAVLKEKYFEITGRRLREGDGGIEFVREDGHIFNGWRISVKKEGAKLYYSDARGAVMAAEAFVSLCGADGAKECEAALEPKKAFRGVHLYLPAAKSMDFAKRLVKYLISPLGYNRAIIEVAGGMKFSSHPEINEAVVNAMRANAEGRGPAFPHGSVAEGEPLDKKDAADFADYLRSFCIDVIPEIQSLGHVQFMTTSHPEIAEVAAETETERTDDRVEDQRPEKLFPHCYCPSKEESYRILFDLADEIIETFRPAEYVHIGHDEVYEIGVCPVCSKKDPAKLFADDVNRIYRYMKTKGLKVAIWSDMLQPVTKYLTPAAIDMIPKDVLLFDFIWYFHMDKDIEDNLLEKGFEVVIGNLYSSHYPRYSSRAYKPGMIGGEISTWVPTRLDRLDREGKIYDFLMTSQMLCGEWDERLRTYFDRLISARIPELREKLTGEVYPSLHGTKRSLWERSGDASKPVPEKPERIGLNAKAKSLIFTQALLARVTKKPWEPCPDAGSWLIRFTDGTSVSRKLEVGKNVGCFFRRAHDPIPHGLYRHNGYLTSFLCDVINLTDERGEPLSWYRDEVILPEGKTVSSVEFVPGEVDGLAVLKKLESVE
ncbi:MAG: family 20 glycosylhydrolase [Clostridia bacterium]|nr:family 20 glycosylhydrolase [Clostridia bacterium]